MSYKSLLVLVLTYPLNPPRPHPLIIQDFLQLLGHVKFVPGSVLLSLLFSLPEMLFTNTTDSSSLPLFSFCSMSPYPKLAPPSLCHPLFTYFDFLHNIYKLSGLWINCVTLHDNIYSKRVRSFSLFPERLEQNLAHSRF